LNERNIARQYRGIL